MRRPSSSPKMPPGVRRLFRLPWSRARMLRELDDEVRFHLEMRVAELRERGLTEAEAEMEARRRFGDAEELREYCANVDARRARRARVVAWLGAWKQDMRFALRQFRKAPVFTAIAVLTLALGIGANTAIFTAVHRLLLAPLPYPDGNRIVMLTMEGDNGSLSPPNHAAVQAWQERARSIEMIAAADVDAIAVQDTQEQDTIPAYITSNFLPMLGVHPVLGRAFTPDEERRGGPAVAMITYGLWQRRYGGRADVLGRTIHVVDTDNRPYTIIGVTPPEMRIPMSYTGGDGSLHEATPSIWLPRALDAFGASDYFARLRPGVSAEQASKELQFILESERTVQARPPSKRAGPDCCARAMRAQDFLDPHEVRAIEVLFVAVGALLLIACANVANLLMARAWTRRREFAVRVALGAGRARLARLVLTESVTLALAGGVLGVGLAWQLLKLIIALRPPALANLASVHLESSVLFWSAGLSVATGILFGSVPALFAGGRSVGDVLRSETRAASGDRAARRVRSALIVAEIAMSLVLLMGAGLLVRSFVALQETPLGFDPHNLIAVDILFGPPLNRLNAEAHFALTQSIVEHVRATPGVTEAAIGTMPGHPYHFFNASLETGPDSAGDTRRAPGPGLTFMTPNYFHVARMRLLEGRPPDATRWVPGGSLFPRTDSGASPAEVVVNRSLAHQLWPDGHVIGARLNVRSSGPRGKTSQPYTVVGVVDDIHLPDHPSTSEPEIYRLPARGELPLVARVSGSAREGAAVLRHAIAGVDQRLIIQTLLIGDDYISDAFAPARFAMALLAAFAVVALLLSAVGLYGVIAYSVSQRTREIGVRVALGAQAADVARLVLGEGIRFAAMGVVLGIAGALAATRALRGMLYGVGPTDPLTFIATALVLAGVALLASYLPARRALRVDPTEALRAE